MAKPPVNEQIDDEVNPTAPSEIKLAETVGADVEEESFDEDSPIIIKPSTSEFPSRKTNRDRTE